MADMRPLINERQVVRRLQAFYDAWREDEKGLWNGAHCVTIAPGRRSGELLSGVSFALHVWLLGYECRGATLVFTQTQARRKLHVLCKRANAELWRPLSRVIQNDAHVEFALHVLEDNQNDTPYMDHLLLMTLLEEVENDLISAVQEEGKMVRVETRCVDVIPALIDPLAVKDDEELQNVALAARFCAEVMDDFVYHELAANVFENGYVTHAELTEETESVILDPSSIREVDMHQDVMGIPYPPVFQSGHRFDLGLDARSDREGLNLQPRGVIICSLAVSYLNYCGSIARTYFIDPEREQIRSYEVLVKAHEAAISALKPGNPMSAAYHAARGVILQEAPELVWRMTRSAGWGMGLERREFGSSLNAGNSRLVKAGMVFNVRLGLEGMGISDPEDSEVVEMYSLLVGDTVIVGTEGEDGPEVLTADCSKLEKDVSFLFIHSDEEVEDDEEEEDCEQEGEVSDMESEGDYEEGDVQGNGVSEHGEPDVLEMENEDESSVDERGEGVVAVHLKVELVSA